ncbi:exosome protein [Candidatus Bathyarchaeota archaeon]|nr:exosome protein [Candidatus Bathyarchaeota archaeon]
MSSKVPVAYIEIRAFAHATEDEEKVLTAIRNTLPQEIAGDITIKKTNLKGHYGNPITLFEAKIRDKKQVKAFLENLASKLDSLDKEILNSEIKRHLNKASLYIRLDKQAAYLNKIKLCTADPIHFRIHFKKSKPEEIIDACRRLGLLP